MPMQRPSKTDLETWLDAIRKDRASLEARLKPLLEERRRLEEQETLLAELLVVVSGRHSASRRSGPIASAKAPNASGGTIKDQVVARVAEILEEAGRPLHINEIYELYRNRGWPIPGAGRPVNITTHIRDSHQIVSPKRGIYALASQVPGSLRGPGPSKSKKAKEGGRK